MPTLADIYSAADSFKRRLADTMANPTTSFQQMVGYGNDRAKAFNQQGDAALSEFQKSGNLSGPQQMELSQQLASGYGPTGMTVWHGSPYKFKAFDASKIGTGEGAQAYGHGLYVAQNPEVAKGYQKTLSKDVFNVGGEVFDPSKLQHLNVRVPASKGDLTTAINKAKEISYSNSPSANLAAQDLDVLNDVKAKGGFTPHEGNLYQIDLPDEHIDKMLHWDKPLSQQPDVVKNWLKDPYNPYKSQLTAKDVGGSEPNGSLIYNRLSDLMSEGKKSDVFTNQANYGAKNASQELSDSGIPGIKYLDENSRNAGDGTKNFVIFPGNEHLLQIQDVNGNPIND